MTHFVATFPLAINLFRQVRPGPIFPKISIFFYNVCIMTDFGSDQLSLERRATAQIWSLLKSLPRTPWLWISTILESTSLWSSMIIEWTFEQRKSINDHQHHCHNHQQQCHDHQQHCHDHQQQCHDHQRHWPNHQHNCHDHQRHCHDHQQYYHDHQHHCRNHQQDLTISTRCTTRQAQTPVKSQKAQAQLKTCPLILTHTTGD